MDARVTKQRLGNMLSYDWLKILCTIAAAVVGLILFFTMVRVQPARAQKFIVHFYGDNEYGMDYVTLPDVLERRLSYDVLTARCDRFGKDMMDDAAYNARRSTGEGSVVLVSAYAEEGKTSAFDEVITMAIGSSAGKEDETLGMVYAADEFFGGLEEYLVRFFGEDWEHGELDAAEAEKCFRARNVDGPNNRNRYRTAKQIAAGIEDEKARLKGLREDYMYLLGRGLGKEDGLLPFFTYTTDVREYKAGVSLAKLSGLSSLVYRSGAEKNPARDRFVYLIYNNGGEPYEEGKTNDGRYDLRYEAVTFLKYLAEQYAPAP